MSEASVRGVIHFIDETKTFGQSGFRKRVVVLEQDNGRFTNYIPVEFVQDGCDTVDELKLGDDVEVSYRLNGRKWQKDAKSEVKYFLNAEATSFKVHGGTPSAENASASASTRDESEFLVDDDEVPS